VKPILTFFALLSFSWAIGQAFTGNGDVKFQVAGNFQNHGTGIMGSLDFGLGDNISFGFSSAYLLGVETRRNSEGERVPVPGFKDRFDLKGRFHANLGNVFNMNPQFDIYPGLDLSLKNFGGHLGFRYFFTYGFGVFTEVNFPLARYKTGRLTASEKLHNQFTVNVGASFGI